MSLNRQRQLVIFSFIFENFQTTLRGQTVLFGM